MLAASLALGDDFKTVNGKEYKNATVSRVEPDGVVIKFHGGIAKIFFVELYFAVALGQKMWQRSDGAMLSLPSKLIVRLELPAAHEYETKLKAEKEQKARQSVPQF